MHRHFKYVNKLSNEKVLDIRELDENFLTYYKIPRYIEWYNRPFSSIIICWFHPLSLWHPLLWLETSKFKLSWFLRSIRQPNQSDHDWVEEIDYQSPSQWDLTLIYPDSTLSLTILAWLILFHFQFKWIFTSLFLFILPQNVWHFYTLKWLVRCYFHGASLAFPIQHVFVF